jgi:hypothetical protein
LKRSLEETRYRWADNIRLDLKKIRCEDTYWIKLTHDMVQRQVIVNMLMNFLYSTKAGNFLANCAIINLEVVQCTVGLVTWLVSLVRSCYTNVIILYLTG